MLSELERQGKLYQSYVADEVAARHGEPLVGYDDEGLPFLKPPVVSAFQELTGDAVVWCMSGRYWRHRRSGDTPGREQRE